VGFNMSWIFVDGIEESALYKAFDLAPTGEAADEDDLGTSRVPLAGATLKSGWCAVFAKYALVMDLTMGTNPPRLSRLPAKSRSVVCVVLEHAMISYASCWHGSHRVWEVRHDGGEHLEISGDLPSEFAGFRSSAMDKQRAQEAHPAPPGWSVDYVFDVPLETAATMTGYRQDRAVDDDFFRNVQTLVQINGLVLTKLSEPPTWWQTAGSTRYE